MNKHMSFGQALAALKLGDKVCRVGWNGKGMFLLLINPYLNDQFKVIEQPQLVGTLMPWIGIKTANNELIPWVASTADLLAEDWMIAE